MLAVACSLTECEYYVQFGHPDSFHLLDVKCVGHSGVFLGRTSWHTAIWRFTLIIFHTFHPISLSHCITKPSKQTALNSKISFQDICYKETDCCVKNVNNVNFQNEKCLYFQLRMLYFSFRADNVWLMYSIATHSQ